MRLIHEDCSSCGEDYECELDRDEMGEFVVRPDNCPHCGELTEDESVQEYLKERFCSD